MGNYFPKYLPPELVLTFLKKEKYKFELCIL